MIQCYGNGVKAMGNDLGEGTYFAVLPAHVRYDENLKPAEILMFGEITSLLNDSGFCEINKSYFAELYQCSIQTVTKYLNSLVAAGYIEIYPVKHGNLIIVPYLSKDAFLKHLGEGGD